MRKILCAITLLVLTGCEDSSDYKYEPLNGVKADVVLGEIDTKDPDNTVVHFNFVFINNSKKIINFDTKKVEMIVNGAKPKLVHYNSLASNPWAKFTLREGISEHNLYLYTNSEIIEKYEFVELDISNFGLQEIEN
jgi:hypothetical protein